MKIIDEIEEANYWRERELISLSKILVSIKDEVDKNTLLNASIPLIYAHWEGFVICSLKILMEDLNERKLSCIDIHVNILTNGYEINLKEDLSKPTYKEESFRKKCKKMECLLNLLNNNFKFIVPNIDTKSNLDFGTLKILCNKFNFSYSNFLSFEQGITKLVMRRNGIAHGEKSFPITKEDMEESVDLYMKLTALLKNEVESFIIESKFLKK